MNDREDNLIIIRENRLKGSVNGVDRVRDKGLGGGQLSLCTCMVRDKLFYACPMQRFTIEQQSCSKRGMASGGMEVA